MASPIKCYQSADRDIVITHDDVNLTSATEIEFVIDAPDKITKTLTGGGISGVSATQFTVTVEDSDTSETEPGQYEMQVRSTIAGIVTQGIINPTHIMIVESKFD